MTHTHTRNADNTIRHAKKCIHHVPDSLFQCVCRFPRGNGIGVDLAKEGIGKDLKGIPLEVPSVTVPLPVAE